MTLGERMKEYEFQSRTRLLRRLPVIIRLDGCHFHTWTRGLDKPYDTHLTRIMQSVTKYLCEHIQGCVLGYTQSDEITLVLIDYQNQETDAWFDNQVQKICSVSASLASVAFNKYLQEMIKELEIDAMAWEHDEEYQQMSFCYEKAELLEQKMWKATFDARAFNVPKHEVVNNLIWRQQDATRNSINLVGQSLYSHKELQGISAKDLQNKMLIEKNVNWNNYPTSFKRGSCVIRKDRKWVVDDEIPIFTQDRHYIDRLVQIEQ